MTGGKYKFVLGGVERRPSTLDPPFLGGQPAQLRGLICVQTGQ
jgi:hypothetical protein